MEITKKCCIFVFMETSIVDKLKDYSNYVNAQGQIAQLFMEFYEKVKHGDQEHQDWLKNETIRFIEERIYGK